MKTITLKTEKVQGKLYAEVGWNDAIRIFTNPEISGRETISVNKHEVGCELYITRQKLSYIWSPAKNARIEIPEAERQWSYSVYRFRFDQRGYFNPTAVHAQMILVAAIPNLQALFDDKQFWLNSLMADLKGKAQRLDKEVQDLKDSAVKKQELALEARGLLRKKDATKIAAFLKRERGY